MHLFAPALAFVDLETTGMGAARDGITEIGIVRVDADPTGASPPQVREWSTLVNPGVPIPPEIQALTGITPAMVRDAPPFAAIAATVLDWLGDALFVAHNARFDYGFLKHAFAREGLAFSRRVLCTVKLSRRLFPEARRHGLDAVVARHAIACADRHRALGDARALWQFVQALHRDVERDTLDATVRRVLRTPSLPPHLAADAIESLPQSPGVYLFYGLNALPLYVGKSRNLRERVGAHFSSDYRSATDLRLSSEVRRIEHEETAGEIGALIREATLVKACMPAHNHALRRKAEAVVLELATGGPPRALLASMQAPSALPGRYGPFGSRRQARETLRRLASEHRLCWSALGLEKRLGPCFARQVHRCAGACVGEEPAQAHHERLLQALAPWRIPPWPFDGPALLREAAALGERVDVHVVQDWCWLGTARDEGELGELLARPPHAQFDPDITRLLLRTHAKRTLPFVPAPVRRDQAASEAA